MAFSTSGGTPRRRTFTSFEYATTPPRKTSLDAGHVGEARPDQAARAGLGGREREPERATAVEDELRNRPLVRGEQVGREALREGPAEALGPPLPARGGRTGRHESPGRGRRPSPRARRPRPPPPRAPGRRRTRSARRSGERGAREPPPGRGRAGAAADSRTRGQSRAQLAGRPGQGDRQPAPRAPGGRPAPCRRGPARPHPSGMDACLRTPGDEVGVRPPDASRRPRARPRRSPARAPRPRPAPGRRRGRASPPCGRRGSGRARPRGPQTSASQRLGDRLLELGRDRRRRRGSGPARGRDASARGRGRRRWRRPCLPRTSSLPVRTTTARGRASRPSRGCGRPAP